MMPAPRSYRLAPAANQEHIAITAENKSWFMTEITAGSTCRAGHVPPAPRGRRRCRNEEDDVGKVKCLTFSEGWRPIALPMLMYSRNWQGGVRLPIFLSTTHPISQYSIQRPVGRSRSLGEASMARIYTRTGDNGETALGDGSRRTKSDPRVDAYGDVDELNSVVGLVLADVPTATMPAGLADGLTTIQHRLFDLGAVLADPVRSQEEHDFGAGDLEGWIDGLEKDLAPLKAFILPGGCPAGAMLHLARTVCRRAERKAVALAAAEPVPAGAVTYLNRLSDYLFTAARAANAAAGCGDVPWLKER